jgi:hypothetical protein
MKATRFVATTIASLLLGIAVPMYAQHDEKNENHSDQKQASHQQVKSEQRGQHQQSDQEQRRPDQQQMHEHSAQADRSQQARRNENAQQGRAQQQRREQYNQQQHAQQQRQVREDQRPRGYQQRRNTPEHRVQQTTWEQHRSRRWESDHRNWRQRGGYHGYRVPEDRFRGQFGSEHAFRIYGLPFMVYRGYPRFQYGGYWITAVDPWPEYWGNGWYDNDDVYVAYVDDGYYLYNRRYPTVGIAVRISM